MTQETARSAPPQAVDIRTFADASNPLEHVLVGEKIVLGDQVVEVHISPVVSRPLAPKSPDSEEMEPSGKRVAFGVFVSSNGQTRLIQHIRGPLQHSVEEGEDNQELLRERRALELITPNGTGASVVGPLARAHNTDRAIYESTAPGVRLDRLLTIVGEARERKELTDVGEAHKRTELTDMEASALVEKFHNSAYRAFEELHRRGLVQGHTQMGNLNVDLETGEAMLFDYTKATSIEDLEMFQRMAPFSNGTAIDGVAEDKEWFEAYWKLWLQRTKLDTLALPQMPDAQVTAEAISKLESLVVEAALTDLGLKPEDLSGESIQQVAAEVIAVEQRLISNAPDVYYPKESRRERVRWYITRLLAAIGRGVR